MFETYHLSTTYIQEKNSVCAQVIMHLMLKGLLVLVSGVKDWLVIKRNRTVLCTWMSWIGTEISTSMERNFLRQAIDTYSEYISSLNSNYSRRRKTVGNGHFTRWKLSSLLIPDPKSGVISSYWEKAKGHILLCGLFLTFLFFVELGYIASHLAERGDTGEGPPQDSLLEAGLVAQHQCTGKDIQIRIFLFSHR